MPWLALLLSLGPLVVGSTLLRFVRSARIVIPLLLVLGAALAVPASLAIVKAVAIHRTLDQRIEIPVPADRIGPASIEIAPLPGCEGLHVSVVGLPVRDVEAAELLRTVPWELDDPGRQDWHHIHWFEAYSYTFEDDGAPLFQIGDHPLHERVSLRFVITPETQQWLSRCSLRVRPDWLTLTMLPLIASVFSIGAGAWLIGAAFCLVGAFLKHRWSRPAPSH